MAEIKLSDLIEIVVGNMAEFSLSGYMASNGAEFFETPYELAAIYNVIGVPYIVYQEEGTYFYDKNKGFISTKAQNKIERYVWSQRMDIPYNKLENDQILLEDRNKMLVELGVVEDV